MKIAFLTSEYPHKLTGSSGGIGTSIKNLTKGLLALGHECRVLVYNQDSDQKFVDEGVVIQQIKNVKVKGLSWYFTKKKLERIINELHSNNEIDIVEAPDWTGITSFIKPKICPIVIRLNGTDTYFCYLDNRPVKWKNKFHEKRALKLADGHIAVSQFTAYLTNKLFNQTFEYTVIPNSIDASNFEYQPENLENNKQVLYFGSIIRKKGLLELPHIFNEVYKKDKEAKLVIIGRDVPDIITGSPSTWEMMKSLFDSEAFKNVVYLGEKPYDEIKGYITQANVCVFPSFAEALPVSWLEAMAMQKSIVASNIGWANEMISNGNNGYTSDPKDYLDFAEKIVTLITPSGFTKEIGRNARKTILSRFDIPIVAQQSVDFYQSIITNKNKVR
ncbi:glycosyltransferase family 4 protein [Flavobacterium oreochromis]|uniref:glycosyltransferase family 4 protein n=1 Tax=Flavobacterium oreochromis TaxID=2906078 RepID=UPI00385FC16D